MGFRENLRETLIYEGLQQIQLAQRANISLSSVENYLREGEKASVPSAEKAVQIAQVLGVTVEYLVTGKNSPEKTPASIDPEIQQLIQVIKDLPRNKQRIVIKNALSLAKIIQG